MKAEGRMEICEELVDHRRRLARFRAAGLGASMQTVLMQVADADEPPRMSELAGVLGATPSAMTSLVDRMEAKRLVSREPAVDRRVVVVVMENAGFALLKAGLGVDELMVEGGAA